MQNFYQLLECIPVWTASLHLSLLHSVLSPMLTLICQPDFLYQELYIWIERLSKINSDLNWTVQEFPLKDSLDYCFYFFVSAEILWLQIDGLIANLWSVSSEALPLHDSTSTTFLLICVLKIQIPGREKGWPNMHHIYTPVMEQDLVMGQPHQTCMQQGKRLFSNISCNSVNIRR